MTTIAWELLWKSTALLLATALVATLAARLRLAAAYRHALWAGGLLALLVLPLASLLPGWNAFTTPALLDGAASSTVRQIGTYIEVSARAQNGWPWQEVLLVLYAAGVLVLSFRWALGQVRMQRLLCLAEPGLYTDVVPAHTQVLLSGSVAGPLVFGFREPVILLPLSARKWTPERLRLVLLHESAHIRRGDLWSQALCQLAVAVFWWQPLAWFAAKQERLLREAACDDEVVRQSAALDYAAELLALSRETTGQAWPAALAMARPSSLEQRLLWVLDEQQQRVAATRRPLAVAAVLLCLCAAPLALLRAQGEQTLRVQLQSMQRDPAAGVNVRLLSNDGPLVLTGITDGKGEYRFEQLPPGEYVVQAFKSGGSSQISMPIRIGQTGQSTGSVLMVYPPPPAKAQMTVRPAPGGAGSRLRIGSEVQKAKLIYKVTPVYPDLAKSAGVQGAVELDVIIGADGAVRYLDAVSGHPLLRPAAFDAVRQWRYETTLLNGNPVEVETTVTVNFTLLP